MRVFFRMEALTSALWILSSHKRRLVNLSSEKFDMSPIILVIIDKECLSYMCIKGTAQEIVAGGFDF